MELLKLLEKLPWIAGALTAATIFGFLTIITLLIVRKTIPLNRLKAHHDVAGFVFTNLGVLYSVLLDFTVVNVQQRYDKIKETVQMEASCLADLYRDAEVFSQSEKNHIHEAIKNYTKSVIQDEWPNMSDRRSNPKTSLALQEIWNAYYSIEITTSKQQAWYSKSIDKLNELLTHRLGRFLGSEESLSQQMWALLIFGGLVLTTFICFFGLDHFGFHLLMAAIMSFSTGVLIYFIYSMDTAFSGNVYIEPEAFIRVIQSISR